jgi:hypothetical protein
VQNFIPIANTRANVALLLEVHCVVEDICREAVGLKFRRIPVALGNRIDHHHENLKAEESKK